MSHPRVDAIAGEAREAIERADSSSDLEALRVRYLGRQGALTLLLRSLGALPAEERPVVGAAANEAKRELEALLESRLADAAERERRRQRADARLDLTLPGRRPPQGAIHPLTRTHDEIVSIFVGLGFSVAEGPEIETDFYNFEALNIPRDHPARDMQDTFYVSDATLLRTHTSPVQIRALRAAQGARPVKTITPGRVYRRDVADASHSPVFHQVEGLAVDTTITMADLKGTLALFAREMFGARSTIRFRPSFFPFTEPSVEVDMSWNEPGKPWLEIGGAGMVDPHVLSSVGYDPDRVSGFAFGLGVERFCMRRYDIRDIRLFTGNDLQFLRQF